jgi:predicted branched-subunit amino acid permease
VGLTFYIAWNLFTLAGIVLGKSIPGLDQLGLDFSIVATFIALITPVVRNVPTWCAWPCRCSARCVQLLHGRPWWCRVCWA